MTKLKNYIDQMNQFRSALGLPLVNVPQNFEQATPIFQKLAGELSPENLHRDGEASPQEAASKRVMLNIVWSQLELICGREVSEADVF